MNISLREKAVFMYLFTAAETIFCPFLNPLLSPGNEGSDQKDREREMGPICISLPNACYGKAYLPKS